MEQSESVKKVQAKRIALGVVAAAALGGAIAAPAVAATQSHQDTTQQMAWDRELHGEPYYI
ncbi:hypothetical protein [Micromonospora sp. NPDC049102]|uniref:hypothetical protein n=1 Tax=Micromonospora sp. NPDC049102 TaxID=3364265 RepID=UPI003710D48F